jgi:hypothetical protein
MQYLYIALMTSWAYVRLPVVCLKALRVKYYIKTSVLPVVLYGYATWSISQREAYRLRWFENIFSREKVTEDGRKLHSEELRNL